MTRKGDHTDPKGLILEAYRIEAITKSECRSIFLDWALSLPDTSAPRVTIDALLARYGADNPTHPMTEVLREGRDESAEPRRRGGWRSRARPNPRGPS